MQMEHKLNLKWICINFTRGSRYVYRGKIPYATVCKVTIQLPPGNKFFLAPITADLPVPRFPQLGVTTDWSDDNNTVYCNKETLQRWWNVRHWDSSVSKELVSGCINLNTIWRVLIVSESILKEPVEMEITLLEPHPK